VVSTPEKPQTPIFQPPHPENNISGIPEIPPTDHKDFGFGRFYTTQDLIESFPGTPLYESPDTLLSKPYNDNASDVWAMGAIFYEMVTGKVLFSNVRTMIELKAAINQEPSKYLVFAPGMMLVGVTGNVL
jgi:serine/threonine protein kinase